MTPTAAKSVANVSRKVRWVLAVTMAIESSLVLYLTLRDFALAATLTATIGSATLLAISGVGFWAAYATWVQDASWLWASVLGQFLIGVLAGYTVLIDARNPLNPFHQIPVGIFASILGITAIFWVFYLLPRRSGPRPAWTTAIAALIPVLGFVQFWLQTDYLPRTSMPLVDLTTDQAPTGKTGKIVRLEGESDHHKSQFSTGECRCDNDANHGVSVASSWHTGPKCLSRSCRTRFNST